MAKKKPQKPIQYRVKSFYADTLVGTIGESVKEWTDPNGNKWVKLFFGHNAGGQKLTKSFPIDVLHKIENH